MCRHRFGHNGYFLDIISPVRRISEHFRRMNIANYVIYIPIVHNNFGDTRLHKHVLQVFERGRHIHCHHFRTGNNTVAYFYIREINRILKDFNLRIQHILISSILYTPQHEIIQKDFAECLIGRFLIYPHAK